MRKSGIGKIFVFGGPLAIIVGGDITELLVRSFEELCVVFQSTASDTVAGVTLWGIVDLATQLPILLLFTTIISLPLGQLNKPRASHLEATQNTK